MYCLLETENFLALESKKGVAKRYEENAEKNRQAVDT